MKKLLLFTLLVTGFTLNAQKTATHQEAISKQKKGKFDTYIASNGEFFVIGNEIILGTAARNENYDFITMNLGLQFNPLPTTASGSNVIIKSIKIDKGLVQIKTSKPIGQIYGLRIHDFEGALKSGEIESNMITKSQAIAKLKESKDLLDLEIINQEEYDKIKKELTPIIKG